VPADPPPSAVAALAASATTVGMPAAEAIIAASTLVAIPPMPWAFWLSWVPWPALRPRPSLIPSRSARSLTSVIRCASPRRGSPSYRPSTSESRMSAPARVTCATSAASRSLSPNLISSVATVSFSLTTGSTPSSSSRSRVRWALR